MVVAVTGAPFALHDPESLLPGFVVRDEPDVDVIVEAGDLPRSAWRFSGVENVEVGRSGMLVRMRVTEWDAVIDLEARRVEARLAGPWTGALDSLLKTLVQLVCLQDGSGLLFHGAGVVVDGAGYLFVGRSGAGKTTVADLSEGLGALVLSEEMSCVAGPDGAGQFRLQSMPLRHRRRREVRPCEVPLAGIFDLVQAPRDAVVPLAPGPALTAVLRSVTTGVRHEYYLRRAFVASRALLAEVPIATLEFKKGPHFWQVIRGATK